MSTASEPDINLIREWQDHQAISDQLYRYARAMDRMDDDLGRSVFHSDAVADYGDIYQGTGYGFIEFVHGAHEMLTVHTHQLGNILIKLEGDTAGSESYVTVSARQQNGDTLMKLTSNGRYIDRWERRGDGIWRIAHRQYIQEMDELQPVDSHYASAGVRDRSDPSYAVVS